MIKREGYGCEVAFYDAVDMSASVTDHMIPISKGGAIWDRRNHMAMSHLYHNKKRGYEKAGLNIDTMKGMDGLIPVDRTDIVRLLLKESELIINRGGVD